MNVSPMVMPSSYQKAKGDTLATALHKIELRNAYQRYWRRQRRRQAVRLLGGRCAVCKSKRRLEFDHIRPESKTVPSNRLITSAADVFWREIAKCQLLCHKCHLVKTAKENSK